MIYAQILLIAAILYVLFKFLSSPNSHSTQAWKKIILVFFFFMAIVTIITPGILNSIANGIGIGRGADLLLYLLIVAFLFENLNRYSQQKVEQRRTVSLARKIAILEANESKHNKSLRV